jgi:hypothetical protein
MLKFPRFEGHPALVIRVGGECPEWGVLRSAARSSGPRVVVLVLSTGIGVAEAGRDLGVDAETLRNWVK